MPPAIDIARRFAEAVIALGAIHDFDDWMGQFWHECCPSPDNAARARVDRGAGHGIVWHESETTIYGFLPDRDGCFCVPREMALPEFAFTAGRVVAPYGQDIVISAAMREELHSPGS